MGSDGRIHHPPSPCTSVCVIDRRAGLCEGCLRTLDEIAAWEDMSAEEQWGVLRAAEERRARRETPGSGR